MSPRVMVVDDDARIRRAIAAALGRAGFDVCTADDGATALRLAAVAPPDLVLVDFHMPTPGLEVVRAVKAGRGPNVYVAVLTGTDDEESRARCFAEGADAVFVKPISSSELRRRLTAAAVALAPVSASAP